MWFWGEHMGLWWWWGALLYILFLAAIVVVIIFLIKAIAGSGKKIPPSEEDPLEILKRRYAKGEISKKQFDEMKKDLES